MVLTKVDTDSQNHVRVEYYETEHHKEGFIELTLSDPADVGKLHDDDTYEIPGVCSCSSGQEVTIVIHHSDETVEKVRANCA